MQMANPEQFDPPEGTFLVILDNGVTVAGGGYRRFSPAVAEVKRMWTNPDYRRQGHAVRILAELERQAGEAGYEAIRLETGPRQLAAIRLYETRGYYRISGFSRYEEALGFECRLS
jgi:ribosomal protein S18 acetylase RimI-like enzyme